jgi:hypothetical protein
MTLALALNGVQVGTTDITIPYYGIWSADVALNAPTSLPSTPGGLTLTVGNLSLLGTAFRAASFAGARSARLVGGYAGWRQAVPPRSYTNPVGNTLAMILADLAASVGEKVNLVTPATLSGLMVQEGSTAANPVPASRLLRQLAGALWWIDPSGVTQIGPRPATAITSPFTVAAWSGSSGSFEIATEDPASWMPGATFSSDTVTPTQTVSSVRISSGNDGVMRLRVLSTGEQLAA